MKKNYALNLLPLLIFFSIFTSETFAQSFLEGRLKTTQDEPVAFANVILLSASDSTSVYKGVVSDEQGEFRFKEVEEKEYLLKVSFVGYENYQDKIDLSQNTQLEPIVMQEAASGLDEVTVNGRRPKITQSVDRITFEVENSSLSTANSFEILKRTPGVIVSQGQLLIKNRPATVYINDRKVYLTNQELQQLLEGYSGANVKSVEVITNPPAKYDAEGGAILNIVTSKNISIGYKGSVNASASYGEEPKYTVGTSQYYKTDWLNAFASYNYNSREDYKKDLGSITFYDADGNEESYWNNVFEKNTTTNSHSLNTILDFTLNEKNSLSLSANLLLTPEADSDIEGLTYITRPDAEAIYFYTTESRLENDRDNIMLNLSYKSQLDEKGTSLSAMANYIKYDDTQTQDLTTMYHPPYELEYNSFYTSANQETDIYTGQVDFSIPAGKIALETGLKYSGIDSRSGLDFYDADPNMIQQEYNENLSDELDYEENIYAAYFSLSRDWEKWSLKTGLRGEYADVQGISASMGAVNEQEYFELFPTFYLMYSPAEDHTYSMEYSRRISRPRFQSLNPYRYFINEDNYTEGNPNLKPGISNKIKFSYTYKSKLSFDLYWDRIDNSIATLPFQDNEQKTLRTVSDNMDFEQQYSLDISYYDYVTDWWYLYAYASFFYMQADFYALENNNRVVTNDVTSTYIMAQNYLTLSKDRTFSGEVMATYLPAYIAGSYQFDDPQYGVSVGLRKTFFNKRLTATLNVDDIFDSMNIPLSSRYLQQNNSFFAMPESRMFRVGLRYEFGNFKLRDNKRATDAEEGERLKEKALF
ncbi:outer membrane beta-barrel protein [Salegentibacter chungangensis]|uniref:Outer membrane beta-barrel protein n=1 Tax=Salegentibacter chungangensis TaxID=1335724 RepID=A0ABW3NP85_9FLAO